MFPALYLHSKQKNRSVAEALHNDNWIRDLMHNLTTSLFVDYVLLWTLVDAEAIHPLGQIEDEITWTRTTDGIYFVKSAYEMQFDGGIESTLPTKFFIWLMLQNRIWTADRMQQREWPNQYFCSFCHRNLETVGH
jgi:hypothetical protein